jgi:hypothetical protein
MLMVGAPSKHVLDYGLWGYLTDPVFLLEPFIIALAVAHWGANHLRVEPHLKKAALLGLAGGLIAFSLIFLSWLQTLQPLVASWSAG